MDYQMKKLSLLLQQIIAFFPKLVWMNNSTIRVEFKGRCLKQEKVTFTPNNVVNLFIAYELDRWSQDLNADVKRLFV